MKNPKSHLQEGIGQQGTLPAWGHCRNWGLSVLSLQGWRAWLPAVVAPGIRAVPRCLSTALWLFPGSEDGQCCALPSAFSSNGVKHREAE